MGILCGGHCCKEKCCTKITTVTTTPVPTCEGFTCPDGQELIGDDVVCATGHCCAHTCCKPKPTTPKPTPANPCTTLVPAGRKYDAKQAVLMQQPAASEKKSGATANWALPLLGVVSMFSLAAFVAVRAKRSQTSTRQIRVGVPQTDVNDDLPFLSDDGPVE